MMSEMHLLQKIKRKEREKNGAAVPLPFFPSIARQRIVANYWQQSAQFQVHLTRGLAQEFRSGRL